MVGVVAGKSSENVNDVDILKKVYPVGAIYMSLTDTNPSLLFGGAWEQIEDVFLYAGKVGDTNYAPGKTGGEKTHQLTLNELPKYSKSVPWLQSSKESSDWGLAAGGGFLNRPIVAADGSTNTASFGNNQAHNNMPPFLAVYMWKRVE